MAASLSLDSFYTDRALLTPLMREHVNYDHPRAIDWSSVERVLRDCRAGRSTQVPDYDFATHTRLVLATSFQPRPVVLMDGLWLLLRPRLRALFDFSIYLDCPLHLRFERRLVRDAHERSRDPKAAGKQFMKTVLPMHRRFVEPQSAFADIVLRHSPTKPEIENLAETIRALATESQSKRTGDLADAWPGTRRRELVSLG